MVPHLYDTSVIPRSTPNPIRSADSTQFFHTPGEGTLAWRGEAGDGHHRGLVAHLAEQARGREHVTGDVHAVASVAGRAVAPRGAGQVDGAGLAVQGEPTSPGQPVAPAGVAGLEEGFEAGHGLAEVLIWPDACLGLDQRFSRGRDITVGDAVVLGEARLV